MLLGLLFVCWFFRKFGRLVIALNIARIEAVLFSPCFISGDLSFLCYNYLDQF